MEYSEFEIVQYLESNILRVVHKRCNLVGISKFYQPNIKDLMEYCEEHVCPGDDS